MIKIGIDPDTEKSGIGFINGDKIELHALTFFELFDFLREVLRQKGESEKILVVIEGGWLNQGNWHAQAKGSPALNAKIGQRTGANHETGKKIVEMVEYLEIPHRLVKPTKSKVNDKMFKSITKIEGRTSQDKRDALMLVWGLK